VIADTYPSRSSSTTVPRTDRATQGRRPLRCLGRPYGPLGFFSSSGATRRTEYLLLEHSDAVWLRQIDLIWLVYIVKVERALQS
jgi:hypothetical protein